MISLSAYDDFQNASTEVLNYLHSQMGFKLWMVTRVESDDWIVLNASDQGYNVNPGDVFRWTDSFCSLMVQGRGPCIAPRSDEIPVYASAPIGQQVAIGAYAGVPLTRGDGRLFGTLCAIDPGPMPDEIVDKLPLIELMSRLLTTILDSELKAQDANRRAEREHSISMTDPLTGLYNRRGWESLVAKEEQRCKRYGEPACLVSIDLDDLKIINDQEGHSQGDDLLRTAANAITAAARETDIVARIGGDEFTILAIHCDVTGASVLANRLAESLDRFKVSASFGVSILQPPGTLAEAIERADKKMYESKELRKAAREKCGLAPNVASSVAKSLDSRINEISRVLEKSLNNPPSS